MKRSNSAAPELSIKDPELLEDGQEEVFSHTAVERGAVYDPPALGPFDADGCAADARREAGRSRGNPAPTPQAPGSRA